LYKTRISVLWLLAIVALFAYATFAGNEVPSILANLSLVNDQEVANILLVLMVLAFLSLTLKGSTNRWTNIIGGSAFGLAALIILIDGVTQNLYGTCNLMMGANVIIMVLVVWFAYKMPRSQA